MERGRVLWSGFEGDVKEYGSKISWWERVALWFVKGRWHSEPHGIQIFAKVWRGKTYALEEKLSRIPMSVHKHWLEFDPRTYEALRNIEKAESRRACPVFYPITFEKKSRVETANPKKSGQPGEGS